jgi:hypothetical protein
MAASTPIVLSAGAVVLGHQLLVDHKPPTDLIMTGVGVALAALAAAGLDAVVPGLGTGTAALMLTAALLAYLPALAGALLKDRGK